MTKYGLALSAFAGSIFVLLATVPARADESAFALNYKWCWQHTHALLGAGTGKFMAHDQFVDGTLRAAKSGDVNYIRQLWEKCQGGRSNMEQGGAAYASINPIADPVRVVRHVVACYPPVGGGEKLPEGSPATPQGQSIGIKLCKSLADS
jgi:hypothetical protein